MGSSLGLCPGRAPTSSQLFLFFAMGSDIQPGSEMEIIVEETISVRECLKTVLEKFGLSGDTWHLRKMDWCYEAGEPLCEEDATLKELMICSGDTLLLTEGKLLPPGLLKVPIWWYQPPGPKGQGKRHLDQRNGTPSQGEVWRATSTPGAAGDVHADVPLRYLGDVEISEDATLAELKAQAMTLPSLLEFFIRSPAFLRAWTVDSKRLGRLLRKNQQQLRDYKLGRRTEICLEPLQKEEHLGPQDMLLRTRMRLPGERAYALPVDMVWDAARATASSLRQRVAGFCSLPVEKIEIAKYFPDKFEWLPVSSWNQQITKRKKKKKQDNLQGAPYYLKDGDIIGIKDIKETTRSTFIKYKINIHKILRISWWKMTVTSAQSEMTLGGRTLLWGKGKARKRSAGRAAASSPGRAHLAGPTDQKLPCPSTWGVSDSAGTTDVPVGSAWRGAGSAPANFALWFREQACRLLIRDVWSQARQVHFLTGLHSMATEGHIRAVSYRRQTALGPTTMVTRTFPSSALTAGTHTRLASEVHTVHSSLPCWDSVLSALRTSESSAC